MYCFYFFIKNSKGRKEFFKSSGGHSPLSLLSFVRQEILGRGLKSLKRVEAHVKSNAWGGAKQDLSAHWQSGTNVHWPSLSLSRVPKIRWAAWMFVVTPTIKKVILVVFGGLKYLKKGSPPHCWFKCFVFVFGLSKRQLTIYT